MKTVVFLGGTLCDERLFAPQVEALRGAYDVQVPTIDGHADGLPAFAAALLADLPPQFAVVGLSLGGIVALEMLRQAPGRITHAALLDTNANADTAEGRAARQRDFEWAEEIGLENFIRTVMLPRQLHDNSIADATLCNTMVQMATATGSARWSRQLALIAHRNSAYGVLASYKGALLIGCGDNDRVCPPVMHEQMAEAAAQAEYVQFANSGHISTLENPGAVTKALQGLLIKEVDAKRLAEQVNTASPEVKADASGSTEENKAPEKKKGGCFWILVTLAIFWVVIVPLFISMGSDEKSASKAQTYCLSPWDGHLTNKLERRLTSVLKDPGSYEAVRTRYHKERPVIYHTFRSKNSFGGYIIANAVFKLDSYEKCNVVDLTVDR